MLIRESEQIRDLVRFDVDYSRLPAVCAQLRNLEEFANLLITTSHLSWLDYLKSEVLVPKPPDSSLKAPRGGRSRMPLGEHLARVHQQSLKAHAVSSQSGVIARREVRRALRDLGIMVSTCVPLSLSLRSTVRRYELVTRNQVELAEFLMKSVATALKAAERFASDLTGILQHWNETVLPREGTVLDVAMKMVADRGALMSGRLVAQTGANKSNVYRAIDQLEAVGILVEMSGQKKGQVWISPEIAAAVQRALG